MQFFNVIGANDQIVHHLKVYQIHKFTTVREGMTYKFGKCIRKPDGLWVVSSSSIGFAKPVTVAEDVAIPLLPEEEPPSGSCRSLKRALSSPQKSTIRAKIVKVSPVKFRCDGTLPVRCLGLKDESGYAKMTLFEKAAEASYQADTALQMTGVYQKRWKNNPQLQMSRSSEYEFLQSEEIAVSVTEDDFKHFRNDPDFCVEAVETIQTFSIDSIDEVASYQGCTNEGCRKKKMVEGVCPTCQGDSSSWTYRARLSVEGESTEKIVTFFQFDLDKLFGICESLSDDDLINWMLEKLPIQFKGKMFGNRMYAITKLP